MLQDFLTPPTRFPMGRLILQFIERWGPLSDFEKLLLALTIPVFLVAGIGLLIFLLFCVIITLSWMFHLKVA